MDSLSRRSDSKSSSLIDAFCGKSAQHSGVEKVRHRPVRSTVAGAFSQGLRMKAADFSRRLMTNGGMTMTGKAIATRDGITWLMADTAAFLDDPTVRPSAVAM